MEFKFLPEGFNKLNVPEQPAFTQFVDKSDFIPLNNDYILQIDNKCLFVNIIKLKKGGEKDMKTEIVRVAKSRMEEYFEEFKARRAKLEEKKTLALEEAIKKITEEIELEFAEEASTLDKLINDVSEEKEIEVKEESVEAVEMEEVANEEIEENIIPEVTAEQPVNQVF